MRCFVILAILLTGGLAEAESPPPPDLTLTWESGEISLDMSLWSTTVTVTGNKLHIERTYSGRNGGMFGTEPKVIDAVIKDPKRLAAAVAAFEKTKSVPRPMDHYNYSGSIESGCLTHGRISRCADRRGEAEKPTAEYTALEAVHAALLDGLPLALLVP